MRSPFGCVLADFLGQSWATSPTISSQLPTLPDPLSGCPCDHSHACQHSHPCQHIHPCGCIPLPSGQLHKHGAWQEAAPGWQGEGKAPASLCWHGCQNICTGQVILTPGSLGTLSSIKPKAPSILSGYLGLNARLGVSVALSFILPGSSKQRSCSAHPERLTS